MESDEDSRKRLEERIMKEMESNADSIKRLEERYTRLQKLRTEVASGYDQMKKSAAAMADQEKRLMMSGEHRHQHQHEDINPPSSSSTEKIRVVAEYDFFDQERKGPTRIHHLPPLNAPLKEYEFAAAAAADDYLKSSTTTGNGIDDGGRRKRKRN